MLESLKNKLSKIKLLAMDFDGVMTDGCVYVDQDGRETVKCSRKDGLGILMLQKNGIRVAVISKEANPVVSARCRKLKIDCWQNIENSSSKLDILKNFAEKNGFELNDIAYIGDDLNDSNVMNNVGVAIAVADAHHKIKKCARIVTRAKGGDHAVREVCELILRAKNIKLEF